MFTSCCSFSMNTNVNTVCGLSPSQPIIAMREKKPAYVSLSQAGVHPFMRNPGPSLLSPSRTTCSTYKKAQEPD
jgi:hypothetical protein